MIMGGEKAGKNDRKKGHICPPSDATHPSERWETAFVYGFITKFSTLKDKVEGLESPADLENALLSPMQHPYLVQILSRFILNLKPQTRNISPDQLSVTLQGVLQEHMKSPERTVFWNDDLKMNVDPLQDIEGGFWGADWDLKLRILRQLVELQLSHHTETRDTIDRAWGVVHNKHKKKEGQVATPLDASDPNSMERLSTVPLGQDSQRRRFWAVDDSPRLYVSTNPWKITATFKSISTTKEEYLQVIEDLKASAPSAAKDGEKKSRIEVAHLSLISTLESRLEAIDNELARIQKVRKKVEQRELRELRAAQVEVRETRTRRQTRRPDYVYNDDIESDPDDDYNYQEEEEYEDQMEEDYDDFGSDTAGPSRRGARPRRSTRNANGKRPSLDGLPEWRGERRSSRIGTQPENNHRHKRARTDESSVSDAQSRASDQKASIAAAKKESAAAVKANEVIMEQVAGKKKSRYWVYAVEHIGPPPAAPSDTSTTQTNGSELNHSNGYQGNGNKLDETEVKRGETNGHNGLFETVHSPSSSSGTLNVSQ